MAAVRRAGITQGLGFYTSEVSLQELFDTAEYWTYRLGSYVLLNLLDEPAWLALMFC